MIFSVIADSDIVFESLFNHNIFGFKKLYFNEFDLNVFDVNVFSLNITVDDFRSLSSIFSSPNVCLPSSLSYPPPPLPCLSNRLASATLPPSWLLRTQIFVFNASRPSTSSRFSSANPESRVKSNKTCSTCVRTWVL